MKLTTKNYGIIKTKNYIKTNNFFFILNGVCRKSNDWLLVAQNLKKISFNLSKIHNKTSKKTLECSVYKNTTALVNGVTFFSIFKKESRDLKRGIFLNKFEPMFFNLLAVKLNSKIYTKTQFQTNVCVSYQDNKLLFFQFGSCNNKILV